MTDTIVLKSPTGSTPSSIAPSVPPLVQHQSRQIETINRNSFRFVCI